MLPSTYPTSPYRFHVVTQGGLKVLLANDDLIERAKTTSTAPLWYMEIGNQESLDAVLRWLRVRRAEWPAWGKLAESKGHRALDKVLRKLMQKDAPAASVGILVRNGEADNELTLGEVLGAGSGLSERIYHVHSFADEEHRNAFRDWLLTNNPQGNGDALLEVGLNEGTSSMSELINKIAADEVGKASSRPA